MRFEPKRSAEQKRGSPADSGKPLPQEGVNLRWRAWSAKNPERTSILVSYLYPGAYLIPGSMSSGALNAVGLAIFFCGPLAVRRLLQNFAQKSYVFVLSDFAVLAMALWMLVSLVLHEGVRALTGAGAFAAVQFLLTYLICRSFFSTPLLLKVFAERMLYVLIATLMYAIVDTLTSRNTILRLAMTLAGGGATQPLAMEAYRFGLVRAQGSLEHPILMGVFFVVSAVLLSQSLLDVRKKFLVVLICATGTVLALSSAPILSALQGVVILLYFRFLRGYPWAKLILWMGVFYIIGIVVLFVDQPIEALISTFTLDPQTGFYRMDIWRWVSVNVETSPWIGIGTADWMRPENMSATIDSLWLVQAVRYGIPAALLLAMSCATTGTSLWLRSGSAVLRDPAISSMSSGLGTAIFILFFCAFSVHFWGFVWLLLAALLGMRAGLTEHSVRVNRSCRGQP